MGAGIYKFPRLFARLVPCPFTLVVTFTNLSVLLQAQPPSRQYLFFLSSYVLYRFSYGGLWNLPSPCLVGLVQRMASPTPKMTSPVCDLRKDSLSRFRQISTYLFQLRAHAERAPALQDSRDKTELTGLTS